MLKAPYIEPEPYDRGDAEQFRKSAAKLSLIKLLSRWMQHDSFYRKACIETSEKWKSGELHNRQPESIADITDGMKMRNSDMMRKATAEEAYDVRLGQQVRMRAEPASARPASAEKTTARRSLDALRPQSAQQSQPPQPTADQRD